MQSTFPRGKPEGYKAPIAKRKRVDGGSFGGDDSSKKARTGKDKDYLLGDMNDREEDIVSENAHALPLKVGTITMGCIFEISEMKIGIDLPNGWRGYADVIELTDSFTSILAKNDEAKKPNFEIGQLVSCYIIGVNEVETGKKGKIKTEISLSLRESIINKGLTVAFLEPGVMVYGSIKSIQEYGYEVSLGIPGATAFCKFQENSTERISVGAPHYFSVASKDGKSVQLNSDISAFKKIFRQKNIAFHTIKPGQLIKCEYFVELSDKGICVAIDKFFGTIAFHHKSEENQVFSEGDNMFCRVLFVDPGEKKIGLTLLPHIIKFRKFEFSHPIGERFKKSVIIEKHKHFAIIGLNKRGDTAILPYKKVQFKVGKDGEKKRGKDSIGLAESTIPEVRVIKHSLLTGMITVSNRINDLKYDIIHKSQISVGQILDATIHSVSEAKLLLQVSGLRKIICHAFHASSSKNVDLTKKYTLGDTVRCRVLRFSDDGRYMIVTLKRELVESKYEIVTSYATAKKAQVTQGFAVQVLSTYKLICFYNSVVGRLYSDDVGDEDRSTYNSLQPGHVVTVSLVKVKRGENSLGLSLNKSGTPLSLSKFKFVDPTQAGVRVGQMVENVSVIFKTALCVILKAEINSQIFRAKMYYDQYSDFVDYCKSYQEGVEPDQVLKGLMIKRIIFPKAGDSNNKVGELILTKKESLIYAFKNNFILDSQNLPEHGKVYIGEYKKTQREKMFIEFVGGFKVTVARKIMDKKPFFMFQTVVVGCSVEKEGEVTYAILKDTFVPEPIQLLRVKSLFETKDQIQTASLQKNEIAIFDKFLPGSIVKGTIKEIKEIGYLITFDKSPLVGFATSSHCTGVNGVKGDKVNCFVLDVDKKSKIIDVSLLSRLVEPSTKSENFENKGTIELLTTKYIILSLPAEPKQPRKLVMAVPSYNHSTKIFDSFSLFGKHSVSVLGKADNSSLLFGSLFNKNLFLLEKQAKMYSSIKIAPGKTLALGETLEVEVILCKDKHTLLTRIPETFVHVQVYFTDIYDDNTKLTGPNLPQENFKYGTKVNVKILQIVEKNRAPMHHIKSKVEIFATMRPSQLKEEKPVVLTRNHLLRNKTYTGYVYWSDDKTTEPYSLISLSRYCRGKAYFADVKDSTRQLKTGDKVRFEVKSVGDDEVIFHKVELVPYKKVEDVSPKK